MSTLLILLLSLPLLYADSGDSWADTADTGGWDSGGGDDTGGTDDTGGGIAVDTDTGDSSGDTASWDDTGSTSSSGGYTASELAGEEGGCATGLSAAGLLALGAFGFRRRED